MQQLPGFLHGWNQYGVIFEQAPTRLWLQYIGIKRIVVGHLSCCEFILKLVGSDDTKA